MKNIDKKGGIQSRKENKRKKKRDGKTEKQKSRKIVVKQEIAKK